MSKSVWILLFLWAPLLAGCEDTGIHTYRVPKEAPASAGSMPEMSGPSAASPAGGSRPLSWKVPAGWQEQPLSEMRMGSYRIPGPNGQSADFSVVALQGDAGGDLANINRWRGQIQLPPIQENDLPSQSRRIHPAGRTMLLVDFTSEPPENRSRRRVVAAIWSHRGETWFFKMIGEAGAVGRAKPAFMEFLQSVRVRAGG